MNIAFWFCGMLLSTGICEPGICEPVSGEPETAVSFDSEIIPVLTKAGCNSGACHGAAAGRGGFHLSLLGADPASDFDAIVLALEGRRINLAHPERSLILLKSTEQIEHGGDVAIEDGSAGAERLLNWIQSGAVRGPQRRLTEVKITPEHETVHQLPANVELRVQASFDGGAWEDVTDWTVFTSSDPASIEVSSQNIATIRRRGQHVLIARFLNRVLPIQITAPLTDLTVDFSNEPRSSFVDDRVFEVLSELRLPISEPATEPEWLRRVTLDLTGRLPEPIDVESFLADSSPEKRSRLVDKLLASDAFADYWTLRFSKLLRVHSLPNESEVVNSYAGWLHKEIQRGTGLDVIARELLTATGDSHEVGPANFARMVSDARGHAELVGQFFLGARLGCANCHNHPLDKWTQDDYHGLAAAFARLDRGRFVRVNSRGSVTNLRTNLPAIPRIPGERYLSTDADHGTAIADWLVSEDNHYFAKATVNRMWRAMFGRGLVEPTDDLRETNSATHPLLLDQLAADFVASGYSIRHTLRLIALSSTYGRSHVAVSGNEFDDRFYSHAFRRPLEPEVLLDSISDVTGTTIDDAQLPAGSRAVLVVDSSRLVPSLDILGRCNRAAGCDENSSVSGGLATQLHLLNGELINRRVSSDDGRLHRHISNGSSDEAIIRDLYVRAFCRPPSEAELSQWLRRVADVDERERCRKLEDFVWSLLNSRQFMENQ